MASGLGAPLGHAAIQVLLRLATVLDEALARAVVVCGVHALEILGGILVAARRRVFDLGAGPTEQRSRVGCGGCHRTGQLSIDFRLGVTQLNALSAPAERLHHPLNVTMAFGEGRAASPLPVPNRGGAAETRRFGVGPVSGTHLVETAQKIASTAKVCEARDAALISLLLRRWGHQKAAGKTTSAPRSRSIGGPIEQHTRGNSSGSTWPKERAG